MRPTDPARRLARAVTEILAPAPIVGALLVAVAWHSAATVAEAARWGLLALLFAPLLPLAYLLREVRRRRLTDRHVRLREQRARPLGVAVASLLILLALLTRLGAPRELTALVGAGAAGLVSATLVTLRWKISIHVATVAGAVVILTLVFGPGFALLAPAVALTGWARVALGDHTPAQVAVGAALGAAIAASVFTLLS